MSASRLNDAVRPVCAGKARVEDSGGKGGLLNGPLYNLEALCLDVK